MDYDLLKYFIKKKGYTQEEMAEKLGVSRVSLCQKLSGKTKITVDEMIQISWLLELSSEDRDKIFCPNV